MVEFNSFQRLAAASLVVIVFSASSDAWAAKGWPAPPAPLSIDRLRKSFRCDGGARVDLVGTQAGLVVRMTNAKNGRVGVLSRRLKIVRNSPGRFEGVADNLPLHIDQIGQFGLREHLTWGHRSCWR
ncbi:hypothetical protein [Sphingomonas crocodyli]|uniref:Uncharacterized protein n=1 Tax=Sphingomonas crocodyli TaxID=1979270 RepID=A0A437M6H7_9SPHN|nr:hypothetical protein [Sphingomonas crocodyli]RVT93104.1 hypothetical protein EOD43_04190 [Sphingomonas crocodyli]